MQKILLSLFFTLIVLDATSAASFPKPHVRFKERKGTMGFVYAVVLGPVGYFGVKIFSRHNEQMCYQAGRGFKIWSLIIASCLILAASAFLKNYGDQLLAGLWASP